MRLSVMELKASHMRFSGCTTSLGEDWVTHVAHDLTNHEEGFLNRKKHLIRGRDTKFSEPFPSFLSDEEIEPVRWPPCSPNMSAHLGRFFGPHEIRMLRSID